MSNPRCGLIMIQILSGCNFILQFDSGYSEIELDLGCGKGGFLLSLAEKYPDRLIIGADVMLGRLRKVDRKVKNRQLSNVLLLRVNAWELFGLHLPDQSLTRIHVLCPDPWPKKRHRSKRLISSEFLGRLSTKLVPNGVFHMATDHQPYFSFLQNAIAPLSIFKKDSDGITDLRDMKTDFELNFEKKNIKVHHISFRIC